MSLMTDDILPDSARGLSRARGAQKQHERDGHVATGSSPRAGGTAMRAPDGGCRGRIIPTGENKFAHPGSFAAPADHSRGWGTDPAQPSCQRPLRIIRARAANPDELQQSPPYGQLVQIPTDRPLAVS